MMGPEPCSCDIGLGGECRSCREQREVEERPLRMPELTEAGRRRLEELQRSHVATGPIVDAAEVPAARTWPEVPAETAKWEAMIEPAVAAILTAYELRPKQPAVLVWRGLPIGRAESATCVDLAGGDAELTAWLRDKEYEHDRAAGLADLRILLGQIIRVGIEQGRRCEASGYPSRDHGFLCAVRHLVRDTPDGPRLVDGAEVLLDRVDALEAELLATRAALRAATRR